MCGEHSTLRNSREVVDGSSPRVRGTRRPRTPPRCPGRFIPACAGNTLAPDDARPHFAVHPRVCGEHTGSMIRVEYQFGSSPRVRGTPVPLSFRRVRDRFIPACAGNTASLAALYRLIAVHPRVCGEHASEKRSSRTAPGSSPRVRGTLFDRARFIPACAGNTLRIIR